ncbi:MAG: TIGR00341 family protein [Parvularculaceae bacterium]
MRLIEAIFPASRFDEIKSVIEAAEPTHFRMHKNGDQGIARVFFIENGAQELVDALQSKCEHEKDWRILVLPVEATAPKPEEPSSEEKNRRKETALREEIYDDVSSGAELTANFFVLTIASTIVAAIGLNTDNVAAVIGAMVIAPLLGPILAVTLGATLGDLNLIARAGRNAAIGLTIGVGAAALIGLLGAVNYDSRELLSRTVVGLDSMALALAAGVAAALSIVAGVSSALVGVMVAVALLPPAAAMGLFIGDVEWAFAARAGLLLFVNVICIMISSQAVYFWKEVRPRTWVEQKNAARAMRINVTALAIMLLAAAAIILFTPTGVMPNNPVKKKIGDAVEGVRGE